MSPSYMSAKHSRKAETQSRHDPLAADRTILANERTLLAYVRTAITLLAAGFSFLSFFPSDIVKVVGIIVIIPALSLLAIGTRRYYFLRKYLTK